MLLAPTGKIVLQQIGHNRTQAIGTDRSILPARIVRKPLLAIDLARTDKELAPDGTGSKGNGRVKAVSASTLSWACP